MMNRKIILTDQNKYGLVLAELIPTTFINSKVTIKERDPVTAKTIITRANWFMLFMFRRLNNIAIKLGIFLLI